MFLCQQATSLSWFWHCTVHNLVWFVSITKHEWLLPLVIFQIGSRTRRRQSSHPLCPSRVDCMDAIYRARQVHVLYMLCFSFFLLLLFFVISQGRVSSAASSPWRAVLSSSCSPDLGSPGRPAFPAGCGGPSKGSGVSWCPGGGVERSGTALGRAQRCRCRPCRWFPW